MTMRFDHRFFFSFVSCLLCFQAKYFVNDIDYDSIAKMIPVAVLNGRYKIVIKVHHKNKLILSISTVVMAKSTEPPTATSAAATAAMILLKKTSIHWIEHIDSATLAQQGPRTQFAWSSSLDQRFFLSLYLFFFVHTMFMFAFKFNNILIFLMCLQYF